MTTSKDGFPLKAEGGEDLLKGLKDLKLKLTENADIVQKYMEAVEKFLPGMTAMLGLTVSDFTLDKESLFDLRDNMLEGEYSPIVYRAEKDGGKYEAAIWILKEAYGFGLVCELCVRIPYICRLDLLMAGLIANTETRFILGEKTAQEWYRILKQRDFGYQDSLDRDFLSAEAYKKIQKQKEEQKEKERQDREAREVEIRKASLEVKLQGLTIKEAAKVFAGKVPSFVFLDRERTLALLEVYKEHFEDKEIFTDKKVICKLMKFFLDCYENNYITKPVLMNKLGLLKED